VIRAEFDADNVFDRYDIVSGDDLKEAARKLDAGVA
jgi:hypothetical protein